MGKLLKTAILFSALFLGQQAFAQENSDKNQFYIPRFSRENAAKQLSYQDSRNYRGNRNDGNQEFSQNYIQKIEPYENGHGELAEFVIETPVLGTLYEISTDRKPFQLFNNRINLTLSSRRNSFAANETRYNQFSIARKRNSSLHGIVRKAISFFRKQP